MHDDTSDISTPAQVLERAKRYGRHNERPLSYGYVKSMSEECGLAPEQIFAAEREGAALRIKGVRCLCPVCLGEPEKVLSKLNLRMAYEKRRIQELTAAGVTSAAERNSIIEHEINAGAALQEVPLAITRTRDRS